MLNLNDVWYNVNKNIHFLTRNNFSQAPPKPAVYAWYYPLRLSTHDMKEFIEQVLSVLAYDAKSEGEMSLTGSLSSTWRDYRFDISTITDSILIPPNFLRYWENACKADFDQLRSDLMRLSLFMPPLYVGKTNNLSRRIQEHIEGRSSNRGFHQRFAKFAESQNLSQRTVSDLLCVAITSIEDEHSDDYVSLVEYIMKVISAPGFSML